jgi:hypothetical protein
LLFFEEYTFPEDFIPPYCWHLDPCPAHSKCPMNSSWVNEWKMTRPSTHTIVKTSWAGMLRNMSFHTRDHIGYYRDEYKNITARLW